MGPKKMFGVFKKKQKGGLGVIMAKWSTKYVDLTFETGLFTYMNKSGKQNKISSKVRAPCCN
jgi:hypothetical protein